MTDFAASKIPINIEDEMKRSYMDYAMSVIIGRALPDVRDGLKPAHRRVLYGMKMMGLASNRGFRKCAKIVGEVMGNYHPHGDASIYDTLVRLSQDFNMRYPLVDGVVWVIEEEQKGGTKLKADEKIRGLMQRIPGPDFPTGGFVVGRGGIASAYRTGRGAILMRAKASIETAKKGDKQSIVVTEI